MSIYQHLRFFLNSTSFKCFTIWIFRYRNIIGVLKVIKSKSLNWVEKNLEKNLN